MEAEEALQRLGKAVRERRLALGLSQEELAETSGLHRNYIGGIERGERNVGFVTLVRLAAALKVTLPELAASIVKSSR